MFAATLGTEHPREHSQTFLATRGKRRSLHMPTTNTTSANGAKTRPETCPQSRRSQSLRGPQGLRGPPQAAPRAPARRYARPASARPRATVQHAHRGPRRGNRRVRRARRPDPCRGRADRARAAGVGRKRHRVALLVDLQGQSAAAPLRAPRRDRAKPARARGPQGSRARRARTAPASPGDRADGERHRGAPRHRRQEQLQSSPAASRSASSTSSRQSRLPPPRTGEAG